VIVEASEGIADSVAEIVKCCMEQAFKDILPNATMVAELEIKDCWG
jgi:hypothetical protein